MKYLPPAAPKLVQKLKMLRIYLNLTHLMFKYVSLDLHVKNNFYQIFTTCQTHISPKFIKIWHIDISNTPILILMSKMVFMKYLPAVRPN